MGDEIYLEQEDGSVVSLADELKAIDNEIDKCKKAIELGKELVEFQSDERFKLIFEIGYVDGESERLRQALINPSIYRKDVIDNMSSMMSGIRHFRQYMQTISINAQVAANEIEDLETRRRELTATYALEL